MAHPRFKYKTEEELIQFEQEFVESKQAPSVKISKGEKREKEYIELNIKAQQSTTSKITLTKSTQSPINYCL